MLFDDGMFLLGLVQNGYQRVSVSIARQNVDHSKTNSAYWKTKQRDFKAF
jgi:hypothetical protein